ncbi:MAG: hypothetical protein F4Z62_06035 [Rhodothermaceae bacterium]|nr:hypothetical protein [Rhodothermaceae bacterium]MYE62243.1 hypothetical protein [Rhodothermaceae bacterium]
MRFSRRKASVLLTCILVVGGLLAPLSHLVYMAASDMYTPVHGSGHKTTQGECYKDAHDGHAACPYLMLFAVPLIGDLAQPITSPAYDPVAEPLLHLSSIQRQPTFSQFHLARGPPHNS